MNPLQEAFERSAADVLPTEREQSCQAVVAEHLVCGRIPAPRHDRPGGQGRIQARAGVAQCFLGLLAEADVAHGAGKADGAARFPRASEVPLPVGSDPAHRPVRAADAILDFVTSVALGTKGILPQLPQTLPIIFMHSRVEQIHGHLGAWIQAEEFHRPLRPVQCAGDQVKVPGAEVGALDGQTQTLLALFQVARQVRIVDRLGIVDRGSPFTRYAHFTGHGPRATGHGRAVHGRRFTRRRAGSRGVLRDRSEQPSQPTFFKNRHASDRLPRFFEPAIPLQEKGLLLQPERPARAQDVLGLGTEPVPEFRPDQVSGASQGIPVAGAEDGEKGVVGEPVSFPSPQDKHGESGREEDAHDGFQAGRPVFDGTERRS